MTAPIVQVAGGRVRGAEVDGVIRFLNIPYAAPAVGERRFKAPEPHPGWNGERDGVTPGGPNAPQHTPPTPRFADLDLSPLVGDGWIAGDEFLAANVWTPDIDAKGLPVMVFAHGGAFVLGSKDAGVYDGTAFAKSGVVLVTINYRLGLEGFVPVPDGDSNLGLRDHLFAFHWVKDNIAAFGGDPDNVTVFGESAGAMTVADVVASPLAKGLFKRAIVQSGHGSMVRPKAVAERLTRRLAKQMGVTPDAKGFRSKSIADGVKAVGEVSLPTARLDLRDHNGVEPTYGLSKFLPWYGDEVLPDAPLTALAEGVGKDVNLLIGANAEEMNVYFVPTGVRAKLNGLLAWFLLSRVQPKARAVLKAYAGKGKKPGHVFTEALTDLVFRWPSRRFAEAHQGRTHVYEFGWRSPACKGELGACHALELPFVFKTLGLASGDKGFAGPTPPQDLAERIHNLWVGFARDGSLPWGEFTKADRQVYRLETGVAAAEPPMPAAPFVP
jgi:para-nitrobenzyl esterase